jgi:hypothetical protein
MKNIYINNFFRNYYYFIIILLLFFIYYVFNENYENFESKTLYDTQEIVVSRYNENLNWIEEDPFNKHPIIIYNKGKNNNFKKTSKIKEVVTIPNVGRETHTYLYHIINNYDKLADVTIFLPGSTNLPNKYQRAKNIVYKIEETNETTLSCNIDKNTHINEYDFTINTYKVSDEKNLLLNKTTNVNTSNIRPFGKWFEKMFTNNEENNCISWNSIIAIKKKNIMQKPISFYEKLLNEVDKVDHPEAGHFLERSWYAVFYPYNEKASFI